MKFNLFELQDDCREARCRSEALREFRDAVLRYKSLFDNDVINSANYALRKNFVVQRVDSGFSVFKLTGPPALTQEEFLEGKVFDSYNKAREALVIYLLDNYFISGENFIKSGE